MFKPTIDVGVYLGNYRILSSTLPIIRKNIPHCNCTGIEIYLKISGETYKAKKEDEHH